ncbi:hypothetical protein Tco_0817330, partial [Tanacetum coccineum]
MRLANTSPPPSPLSPWSSPLPQIPSPPLPLILSPLPVSPPPPASPTYLLGYRVVMIRLRAEAPSTSYSPPPHIILSHTRADTPPSDRPEVTLPPQKRLGIALSLRYEVGESSSAPAARPPGVFRADYGFVATMDREIMQDLERDVGYGITDTWDDMPVDMPGAPATDDTYDLARAEVMSLGTQVVAQQAMIIELQAADRRRQAVITELLAADRRRQAKFIEALKLLKRLQTQMTEFERQQGPAKGPPQ